MKFRTVICCCNCLEFKRPK